MYCNDKYCLLLQFLWLPLQLLSDLISFNVCGVVWFSLSVNMIYSAYISEIYDFPICIMFRSMFPYYAMCECAIRNLLFVKFAFVPRLK